MRSIVLGSIVAAGLSLVSAGPTVSGTSQRRGHWSSGGGHRYRQPGALLVHMAGMDGYCRRWRCW